MEVQAAVGQPCPSVAFAFISGLLPTISRSSAGCYPQAAPRMKPDAPLFTTRLNLHKLVQKPGIPILVGGNVSVVTLRSADRAPRAANADLERGAVQLDGDLPSSEIVQ